MTFSGAFRKNLRKLKYLLNLTQKFHFQECFLTDRLYVSTKYVQGYYCSIMHNGKSVAYDSLIFKNNITFTFGS